MNTQQIAAVILLIAGALGLAYGGFSYTRETHQADLGPIQMTFDEKERVNIPVWAGIGMLAVGGLLLVTSKKS